MIHYLTALIVLLVILVVLHVLAYRRNNVWSAAQRGSPARLKAFLESNRRIINAKDDLGSTPIHLATERGDRLIVELLVSEGAMVNVRDNYGWTPLHIAAINGFIDIADILIKKGPI